MIVSAPDQKQLAKPRARREHGDWRVLHGFAGIELHGPPRLEMRRRMGDGSQIVQQSNSLKTKVVGQRGFFGVPWQIRQVRATRVHRAGHVETRGSGVAAGLGQERLDDRPQPLVVSAVKFLLGHELAWAGLRRDERQPRRAAADITRDQHHLPGSIQSCWICSSDCPLVSGTRK